MKPEERFETLAREWAEHCQRVRFSSIMADYLNHPTYRELVGLGAVAIPWILDRYRTDGLPWGFVLQEITGIPIIQNPNDFSPREVKRQWLSWWEQHTQAAGDLPTASKVLNREAVPKEGEDTVLRKT